MALRDSKQSDPGCRPGRTPLSRRSLNVYETRAAVSASAPHLGCRAMEFDQLKGFYYVAKLGSFTAAAGRLYLTQPAISLQVKALEKELGERLFDRVGRKIRLTHAGKAIFSEAEDLVGKLDEIQRIAEEFKSLDRGRLALGASDTTSIYVLPDLLKRFVERYPNVDLSISSFFSSEVARRVLDREVDLGIVTLPVRDAKLKLEVLPLFQQRLVCIVAPGHRLATRKRVGIEEFGKERLILLEKGSSTRQQICDLLNSGGNLTKPALELSNFEIIKRYVSVGLGISVVPEATVDPRSDALCPLKLKKNLTLTSGIVYRRDRKMTHSTSAFLEMAKEFFQSPGLRISSAGPSRN